MAEPTPKKAANDRRVRRRAGAGPVRKAADASERRPYPESLETAGSAWTRPRSLFQVVHAAETTEDIGYNLADFLDHVNFLAKGPGAPARVAACLRKEPPRTGEAVQDAYLAAVAAHLARRLRLLAPAWTEKSYRRLERPWFALSDAWARATLLRDSPPAFRERNLFTAEDALDRA